MKTNTFSPAPVPATGSFSRRHSENKALTARTPTILSNSTQCLRSGSKAESKEMWTIGFGEKQIHDKTFRVRRGIRCAFPCAIIMAFLFAAGSSPAVVITFDQVDWLDGQGGFTAEKSEWGVVNIQFSSDDQHLFHSTESGMHGFINVVTTVPGGHANNWAVQNTPMYFNSAADLNGRLSESMSFDLGVTRGATRVAALDFYLTVDISPLTMAPGGTMNSSTVGSAAWLFGGEADLSFSPPYSGNTSQAAPTSAKNHLGAIAGSSPNAKASISVPESNIQAVKEEPSGCAPAAKARSLKYLEATQSGFTVPGTVQDVYDELKGKDYMNTVLGSTGAGTKVSSFLAGSNQYAVDKSLLFTTEATKDIDKVIAALNAGADVEIGVFLGLNDNGESMGGHCAFVTNIVTTKDGEGTLSMYGVKIIDDRNQHDEHASNVPMWLAFDKNGILLNWGEGAKLNSFRIETVIPEPSVILLFGFGLASLIFVRKRSIPGH